MKELFKTVGPNAVWVESWSLTIFLCYLFIHVFCLFLCQFLNFWFLKKWSISSSFKFSSIVLSSVQFSHSVVSDSSRPHESQHARPPCPSPTPGVHSDLRPSSQWSNLFLFLVRLVKVSCFIGHFWRKKAFGFADWVYWLFLFYWSITYI